MTHINDSLKEVTLQLLTILNSLPITRYQVVIQAESTIKFDHYAGSAVRGAFGHALKKVAYFSGDASCSYNFLFEPKVKNNTPSKPVPIIFECHDLDTSIETKQQSSFNIVLIGQRAHDELPIITLALRHAFNSGIGLKNSQRGTAKIISIDVANKPTPVDYAKSLADLSKIRLNFKTPTRLQKEGHILQNKSVEKTDLILAMQRRLKFIYYHYADSNAKGNIDLLPDIDTQGLGFKKHTIQAHWKRYSNRQKTTQIMDGFTGSIDFFDVSESLWAYLYLNQWLHVGKNTVFGLGYYDIDTQAENI